MKTGRTSSPERRFPRPPKQVSEYARTCLEALATSGYGDRLSLGGAFALAYYCEYRTTHDVDAWWDEAATSDERQAVIRCLEEALQPFGAVRTRRWGDVVSVELTLKEEQVAFSFQIATRSAQIEPSVPAPWPSKLCLDAFPDLVASKMVALVERGAPRDFRDIYVLCQAGLTDAVECWHWWEQCQQMAGADREHTRARLALLTHLSRIAQHRPLTQIEDPAARRAAQELRTWFETLVSANLASLLHVVHRR